MGRPRGKAKKLNEAVSNADDGSGGEEAAPTTHKRRGRPQKPPKDGTDIAEDKDDTAEAEEDGDGMKPVVRPSKDSKSSTESGGKKRRRRRLKRSSDGSADEDEDDRVKSKSNGFRQNGSRRKSTPRRAAEAGVECK